MDPNHTLILALWTELQQARVELAALRAENDRLSHASPTPEQ